jgi:hypothetical protein
MNTLAPIVLFVYNRPGHTLRTLQSLAKNKEAKESTLFIFCDGAKKNASEDQVQKIREVRNVIRTEKWCKEVTIVESDVNKGLANSIVEGVTKVVNSFGKIIVLEDDILVSDFFLKYMNEALDLYFSENEVISIHGYLYPVKEKLPETFFLKGADCWGWATWKRRWDLFEEDGKKLLEEIKTRNLEYEFDFNGSYPYMKMLKKQVDGKNDSWAIRWYASAFLKNKLTLYPGKSLVENTGNEGSGTHVNKTELYDSVFSQSPVEVHRILAEANQVAFEVFRKYFISTHESFFKKLFAGFKK